MLYVFRITSTGARVAVDPNGTTQSKNAEYGTSDLAYAPTVALDFAGDAYRTLRLTGDVSFKSLNLKAGRSIGVRIIADGSTRFFGFPVGWAFVGSAAPSGILARKTAILTLQSFGNADADVLAAYAVSP